MLLLIRLLLSAFTVTEIVWCGRWCRIRRIIIRGKMGGH